MRIILLLLFGVSLFSCNQKNSTKKFLGVWENVIDSTKHCKITQSAHNFIIEYSNSEYFDLTESKIIYKGNKKMPAYYDETKDKLLIKWDKELDAIYDNNTNQIIFESWGAFKKIN